MSGIVGPEIDNLMIFLKVYFEKVDFEKHQQTPNSMQNYPATEKGISFLGSMPKAQLM